MKKGDIILFLSAILLGISIILCGKFTAKLGDTVIITKDGKIYGEYPLDSQMTVDVDSHNFVRIENGTAYMIDADCPDKLCINQGKARDNAKKIICLPNRVTVEVTKKSEIDKVVR